MSKFDPLPWKGADNAPPLNREDRRPVDLEGKVIRTDGRSVAIKVVDLSYDGCAILTSGPLTAGEKVKLCVRGRGLIEAAVRWHSNGEAGLLFEASRPGRPHYPRKSERVAVEGEALLRRAGSDRQVVRLLDVSRFGCRCTFAERPSKDERAWIKFEGLDELEATVSWVEEDAVGVFYRNPLHPAVFALQLERLKRT